MDPLDEQFAEDMSKSAVDAMEEAVAPAGDAWQAVQDAVGEAGHLVQGVVGEDANTLQDAVEEGTDVVQGAVEEGAHVVQDAVGQGDASVQLTDVRNLGKALKHALEQVQLRDVGRTCEFFSLCLIFSMVFRTFLYVRQRRKGLVGPAMAPLLIKFWVQFGLLECCWHVLSLYFTPLNGVWLISLLRAVALAVLTAGQRLSVAARLYETKLVPFYDTHSPEVERLFAKAQVLRDQVNDAFREYAKYLLKRIEVGGLTGAMSDLSAEQETAAGDQKRDARGAGRRRAGRALPEDSDVFKAGRQFFAGKPDERAEAVAGVSRDGIPEVIQVASPEPPKATYEDLRKLRRTFSSRRAQATKGKGSEKPG